MLEPTTEGITNNLTQLFISLGGSILGGVLVALWQRQAAERRHVEDMVRERALELLYVGDDALIHANWAFELGRHRDEIENVVIDELQQLALSDKLYRPSRWSNSFEIEFERRLREQHDEFMRKLAEQEKRPDGWVDSYLVLLASVPFELPDGSVHYYQFQPGYERHLGRMNLSLERLAMYEREIRKAGIV